MAAQLALEEEMTIKHKAELEAHLAKQMDELKAKHEADKVMLARGIEANKLHEAAQAKRKLDEMREKVGTDLDTLAKKDKQEGKKQQTASGNASAKGTGSASSASGGGVSKNQGRKVIVQTKKKGRIRRRKRGRSEPCK